MKPFDYVNSINTTKKDIMVDDMTEKSYLPFMINRSLSYFADTVLMANEMNKNHHLESRMQYDFLRNIVRKRKRFSKWAKAESSTDLELIKEYYGYNNSKARQVMPLIDKSHLDFIRRKMFKGGK